MSIILLLLRDTKRTEYRILVHNVSYQAFGGESRIPQTWDLFVVVKPIMPVVLILFGDARTLRAIVFDMLACKGFHLS